MPHGTSAEPGEPVVVDASVAVKWVVEEADSDRATRLLDGRELHAPELLFVEAANALWAIHRLGALRTDDPVERLAWLLRAPFTVTASATLVERALAMATALVHPVYDCVYLSLAAEVAAPVVTADARLLAVAERDPDLARLVVPLGSIDRA